MKNGTTSTQTIEVLRNLFATWGICQHVHTDNGPQFCSSEFEHFMKSNGIKHTTSSVYHPASNGQAERFVSIFKKAMKLMKSDSISLEAKVARFLLTYRTAVNTSTGETPSMLMLGRRMRTRLDLIKPMAKNYKLKPNLKERSFEIGQLVSIHDYRQSTSTWLPGVILRKYGQVMYGVQITTVNGTCEWRRHVDQIIDRESTEKQCEGSSSTNTELSPTPDVVALQQDIMNSATRTISRPNEVHINDQHMASDTDGLAADTSPGPTIPVDTPLSPQQPDIHKQTTPSTSSVTSSTSPKTLTITSRGRVVVQPRKLDDLIVIDQIRYTPLEMTWRN